VSEDDPPAGCRIRFDGHDVEADRCGRQGSPVREAADGEEAPDGPPEPGLLSSVDALLGEAEVPAAPPADLDDDELDRRAGIEGDEIELVPPDPDPAAEDPPAGGREAGGDDRLGGVAEALLSGSHRVIVAPPT
jgi:hypothetical protein